MGDNLVKVMLAWCCAALLALTLSPVASTLSCPIQIQQVPGIFCSPSPSSPSSSSCEGISCVRHTGNVTVNASITVQRCSDPITVELRAQGTLSGSAFNFTYQFNRSATVVQDGATVTATLGRNQSAAQFSAYLGNQAKQQWIIPEITVAINTTDCLCRSMQDLAVNIQSPVEHDCKTIDNCDGVICELDVFGDVYYLETVVLSCEEPPAADVLVEDSNGKVFYNATFNQSGTSVLVLGGVSVTLFATVEHSQYSMDVAARLTNVPLFGAIDLLPRHTIILDPTTCQDPPTVTTSTPSPPPFTPLTPPPTATETCRRLYDIASPTSPPFSCTITHSCTALMCELDTTDIRYFISLRLFPRDARSKAFVELVSSQGQLVGQQVVMETGVWAYSVAPGDSEVRFFFNVTEEEVQFKVELELTHQLNTLIPHTIVPLETTVGCPSLASYLQQNPHCISLEECTYLECLPSPSSSPYLTAVRVERCVDPVRVGVTVVERGQELLKEVFNSSGTLGIGSGGHVDIARNSTHLELSVSAQSNSSSILLIPRVSLPLDPSFCSCQSIEELAEKTHSMVEHDCTANTDCDGMICELDVFGTVYYLETLLLSCEEPPAVDVVVEDDEHKALFASQFNRTGTYELVISGFRLPLSVVIEHHDYSMDVEAYLSIPFIGDNIAIIPPHTVLLDTSSCSLPPSPPSPPPPFTPGPSASDTCKALFAITQETAPEAIECEVIGEKRENEEEEEDGDCSTLRCMLATRGGLFTITITIPPKPDDSSVAVVIVLATNGSTLADVQVKDSTGFSVWVSSEEMLLFVFILKEEALSVKVSLRANGEEPTTLIDSTVPLQGSSSERHNGGGTRALGVAISIVAVVVCVAAVVVTILVVGIWRYRHTRRQFAFRSMTFSDLKKEGQEGGGEGEGQEGGGEGEGQGGGKGQEGEGEREETTARMRLDGNAYEPAGTLAVATQPAAGSTYETVC